MTNEEFERTKEFILQQQAQFTTDIQQLRQLQAQTEIIVARFANGTLEGFKDVNAKINALVDSQIQTDEKVKALLDSQIQTGDKMKALANSQMQTDEKIKTLANSQMQTDEKIKTLANSQMQTTGDLKKLIAVVDRYFSEGRNGN
jgi:hypothetical protein